MQTRDRSLLPKEIVSYLRKRFLIFSDAESMTANHVSEDFCSIWHYCFGSICIIGLPSSCWNLQDPSSLLNYECKHYFGEPIMSIHCSAEAGLCSHLGKSRDLAANILCHSIGGCCAGKCRCRGQQGAWKSCISCQYPKRCSRSAVSSAQWPISHLCTGPWRSDCPGDSSDRQIPQSKSWDFRTSGLLEPKLKLPLRSSEFKRYFVVFS